MRRLPRVRGLYRLLCRAARRRLARDPRHLGALGGGCTDRERLCESATVLRLKGGLGLHLSAYLASAKVTGYCSTGAAPAGTCRDRQRPRYRDTERCWEPEVFVPSELIWPETPIPPVQLSMRRG